MAAASQPKKRRCQRARNSVNAASTDTSLVKKEPASPFKAMIPNTNGQIKAAQDLAKKSAGFTRAGRAAGYLVDIIPAPSWSKYAVQFLDRKIDLSHIVVKFLDSFNKNTTLTGYDMKESCKLSEKSCALITMEVLANMVHSKFKPKDVHSRDPDKLTIEAYEGAWKLITKKLNKAAKKKARIAERRRLIQMHENETHEHTIGRGTAVKVEDQEGKSIKQEAIDTDSDEGTAYVKEEDTDSDSGGGAFDSKVSPFEKFAYVKVEKDDD